TERRWQSMVKSRSAVRGAASDEDTRAAKLQFDRYTQESVSKEELIHKAQRELSAALTTLKMHEIRSSINGVVKVLYKSRGDAVKNLDAVAQVQNPDLLVTEGLAEVQDAKRLRADLDEARKHEKEVWVS